MNKSELIIKIQKWVHGVHGKDMNKVDVAAVLNALGEIAVQELRGSGYIILPALGKLKARMTVARTGRNPLTGQPLPIRARRKALFSESKKLVEALNAQK